MTVLELVTRKFASGTHSGVVNLLREDQQIGTITRDVRNHGRVKLVPLAGCESSEELGYIRKLFELTHTDETMNAWCRRSTLPREEKREVGRRLDYKSLAHTMTSHAANLKGPLEVVYVQVVRVEKNHSKKTLLAVVFRSPETNKKFGYYFHLKAGLLACGLLQQPSLAA